MSINFSGLLKVNCSTYENPFMDVVVDQYSYDLDEIVVDGKVDIEGIWLVDEHLIEIEDGLDFEWFKKSLSKNIQSYMEGIYDLKWIFAKYGLEYTGFSFFTPWCYNYQSDSVDIHLKTMWEEYDLEKMGLKDLILKYIDEVRTKSYDGYISFEPTDFDKVWIDDYCTIRAILEKEGVREMMAWDLEWFFEEGFDDELWENSNPYYEVRVDWKIDYDRKFKLDFENKKLVLIN